MLCRRARRGLWAASRGSRLQARAVLGAGLVGANKHAACTRSSLFQATAHADRHRLRLAPHFEPHTPPPQATCRCVERCGRWQPRTTALKRWLTCTSAALLSSRRGAPQRRSCCTRWLRCCDCDGDGAPPAARARLSPETWHHRRCSVRSGRPQHSQRVLEAPHLLQQPFL